MIGKKNVSNDMDGDGDKLGDGVCDGLIPIDRSSCPTMSRVVPATIMTIAKTAACRIGGVAPRILPGAHAPRRWVVPWT